MVSKKVTLLGIVVMISAAVVRGSVGAWTGETAEPQTNEAAAQVRTLIPLSLQLVDEAVTVLSQGWPQMSQVQKENFLLLYDPAGTGQINEHFVQTVLGNYKKIRLSLEHDIEVVYAADSGRCEGQRLYYTDLIRLYVCPYFFEEESELRKARTMIHEIAHMALLVTDRPYYRPTSKKYAGLTPSGSPATQLPVIGPVLREILRGDTLYHPDAYAHFALKSAGYSDINDWET